jgi:hypothetical protein
VVEEATCLVFKQGAAEAQAAAAAKIMQAVQETHLQPPPARETTEAPVSQRLVRRLTGAAAAVVPILLVQAAQPRVTEALALHRPSPEARSPEPAAAAAALTNLLPALEALEAVAGVPAAR